jgi:hypothetical protein
MDRGYAMNGRGRGLRALMAVAMTAAALLFPAAAGAQQDCTGPTGDQYCPNTEILTGSGSGSGDPQDPQGPSGSSSALPFTGFDVALTLAAGAGLLGAGLALRRASQARGDG